MEAALLHIAQAPIDQQPDKETKLWAREVRNLSYDLEDSIDKFMARIDNFKGFIDRTLDLLTKLTTRHNLGTETKAITKHIVQISERRHRYKVDDIVARPIGTPIESLCLSALYRKASKLVGTEEKSNDLVERLMDVNDASKEQLKIVSIVGFGGLGKTTIANVVYKNLKGQFDCGAFVSVSQNPNMEKIFKNMLHQLDDEKYPNIHEATWGEAQLIEELIKFLHNKRYFIVIDDIWDSSVWERIKFVFVENGCGSRIITTTRQFDVGKHIGGVYRPEPLSLGESQKLFNLRVFGAVDKSPPDELVELSEIFFKKCDGYPLAIITIASVLASQRGTESRHTYWAKVYESMGSGLKASNQFVDNIRMILSLSYQNLPGHLKDCLLFLCSYPEDVGIRKEKLIWEWVGEGFIRKENGTCLYKEGMDYIAELINRGLIQPTEFNIPIEMDGFCRLHDMVLDLITYLSNVENFLVTIGGQHPLGLEDRIHHLVLRTTEDENNKKLAAMSLSHVRSLKDTEEAFNLLPPLSWFPTDCSYCLQVDNRHLKDICNLFQLRYLCLFRTSINKIPKQIRNLRFLHALEIRPTEIEPLPSSFVQLQQLLCLNVPGRSKLPYGFRNLESLQELNELLIESVGMLHDLGRLTKLRNLSTLFDQWDESYIGPLLDCLFNLVNLESLSLSGLRSSIDIRADNLSPVLLQLHTFYISSAHGISEVPRWVSLLSSLTSFDIHIATPEEEDLQVLGSIPSLVNLTIYVKKPTQGRKKKLVIDTSYPYAVDLWLLLVLLKASVPLCSYVLSFIPSHPA